MKLPEYGRYVSEMVKHIATLPTKDERQRCAEAVVSVMASLNPQLREQPDFMQQVWDHLAYIAEYKLDINYPYPITRLDDATSRPCPLSYPANRIEQRQYGHLIEASLAQIASMEEGEERERLLGMVANQMKQSLFTWNRDAMDNEKVAADIEAYTQGRAKLDTGSFRFAPVHELNQQAEGKRRKKK